MKWSKKIWKESGGPE